MRYFLQRIVQFFLVFVVVTFTVMMATRIGSEDPVRDLAGGTVSEAQIERVLDDYPYLDKSLPVQYVGWLGDFFTGDLGYSYLQSQSGADMFKQRMPPTIFIGFWAIIIGLVIAVPVGIYSAYLRNGVFDRLASITSFAAISTPPLVVAVGLLFLVVSRFSVFPSVGASNYVAPWDNPWEHFRNFFIPSLSLGIGMAGEMMSVLETRDGERPYDWIKYLITRYNPTDQPQIQVSSYLRSILEDAVMANEFYLSAAIADAANSAETIIEVDPSTFHRQTYQRAWDSVTRVVSEFEGLVHHSWGRKQNGA